MDGGMCAGWDEFRQSQHAIFIPVQCGPMVSSSALAATHMDSAMFHQIWDQFWQSQQGIVILVRCGQMVSSSASEATGRCDVPSDLGTVSAVAAGYCHTCTVRADGQLVCFGGNSAGQCDVPPDLGPVLAVSAGYFHTCAVRADGRLVCFGRNAMCHQIWGQCWQ